MLTNPTATPPGRPLGQASQAIIDLVAQRPGMTTAQLHAAMAQQHPGLYYNASRPRNLGEHRHIINAAPAGAPARWYAPGAQPRATAPAPSPHTPDPHHATAPDPLAYLAMPAKRTTPDTRPWAPPKTEPARPEGMVAFGHNCPSRTGDQRTPYTGPKPYCVGTNPGIYGPSRVNRVNPV